jgi:hypothetical protein
MVPGIRLSLTSCSSMSCKHLAWKKDADIWFGSPILFDICLVFPAPCPSPSNIWFGRQILIFNLGTDGPRHQICVLALPVVSSALKTKLYLVRKADDFQQ